MTTVETNRNAKSKLGNLRPSNLDVLCVATVLGIVAAWLATPRFSPDSWSYFELSKTVFTDFYRINTYRQFQTVSPYGTSFPPLYPSLLAVGRAVCDVGIYTGVFLNAALCVATLFVVKSLARVSGLPAWVGNILFLALLLRPTYVDELMAARSIPLALLLVTAILRVYVSPALTPSRAVLMGFLAGLAVLTRFDFLAAAVFLGLVLAWYARKRTWLVSPVYFAALAVAVSPWVVYSLVHFSKPFVSDNSRTAMLVARSFVTDYYPHQEQLEYAWDAPLSWASNVIVRRFPRILDSWLKTITTDPTLAVLTGILVGIGVAARARPGCLRRDGRDQRSGGYVAQWRGFAAVLAVQLLTIGVTGYPDGRYLLPL